MIYRIKDLCEVKRGSSPRPIIEFLSDTGYKWLKISDFAFRDRFVYNTKEFIKKEGLKGTRLVEKGTLILTNSATPGIPIFLGEDMCLHDGFLYFPEIDDKVNPYYLFYWFQNFRSSIVNQANGSVFKNLKKEIVENLEIDLPEKVYQSKVVKILDSIDKKIELNNQMNNNLHDYMNSYFTNWIDNLEEYKELSLSEIADYKNGLAMQNYRPVSDKCLPVIKIKEMNLGISDDTEKCRDDIYEGAIIDTGDILFAWSGTLCMKIWCGGRAGLNQHIFKVTSQGYPKWFYYFWTLRHLNEFINIAASKATTMGHIKRTELDKAKVKVPKADELQRVDIIMSPMLKILINNEVENLRLSQLRDILLPKLMNVEIDFDKIEV